MKKKILILTSIIFSFLVLALGFQNCSEGFHVLETDDMTSLSFPEKPEVDLGASPTDAKQTLESMMSLLDLTVVDINMTEVNNEINYRRNLLVPQNDLRMLNAPAIIAITSLAGVVCKQAVAKEKRMTTKEIFPAIDFTKGPRSYGKQGALKAYAALAERLWARPATAEETQYFTSVVDEYFSTLDAAALDRVSESDKLAIFICTGMLSVPDSYLL